MGKIFSFPNWAEDIILQRQVKKQADTFIIIYGIERCFTGDTLVKTSRGHVPINNVECGDRVLSFDEKSGKMVYNKVIEKYKYSGVTKRHRLIRIKLKDGKQIVSTFDHEFYQDGGFVPAYRLAQRAMERDTKHQWEISNKQYGQTKDYEIQSSKSSERSAKHNETRLRCWRIPQNHDSDEWEAKYCKDAQTGCSGISSQSRQQTHSQPQEWNQERQQSRESGMDDPIRELSALTGQWLSKKDKRFGSLSYNSERAESQGNSHEAQTEDIHKTDASGRIQRRGGLYKDDSSKEELEACQIDVSDIVEFELFESYIDVYDLQVENTHTYTVTKDNIIVHNSGKSTLGFNILIPYIKLMKDISGGKYKPSYMPDDYPSEKLWDPRPIKPDGTRGERVQWSNIFKNNFSADSFDSAKKIKTNPPGAPNFIDEGLDAASWMNQMSREQQGLVHLLKKSSKKLMPTILVTPSMSLLNKEMLRRAEYLFMIMDEPKDGCNYAYMFKNYKNAILRESMPFGFKNILKDLEKRKDLHNKDAVDNYLKQKDRMIRVIKFKAIDQKIYDLYDKMVKEPLINKSNPSKKFVSLSQHSKLKYMFDTLLFNLHNKDQKTYAQMLSLLTDKFGNALTTKHTMRSYIERIAAAEEMKEITEMDILAKDENHVEVSEEEDVEV